MVQLCWYTSRTLEKRRVRSWTNSSWVNSRVWNSLGTRYSCLFGVEMTSSPEGSRTRTSSASAALGSFTCSMVSKHTTRSKLSSPKGSAAMSPTSKPSPYRSRARRTVVSSTSTPVTLGRTRLREHRRAVALPASHVEHSLACSQTGRHPVASEMFRVDELTVLLPRDEPLARGLVHVPTRSIQSHA